jgi:hypothetical protein
MSYLCGLYMRVFFNLNLRRIFFPYESIYIKKMGVWKEEEKGGSWR